MLIKLVKLITMIVIKTYILRFKVKLLISNNKNFNTFIFHYLFHIQTKQNNFPWHLTCFTTEYYQFNYVYVTLLKLQGRKGRGEHMPPKYSLLIHSYNTMITLWGRGSFLFQYNHETQCSLCAWKRRNFLCLYNQETQCSLCAWERGGGVSCANTIMKLNVPSVRKGNFLCQCNHETHCSLCGKGNFLCLCNHETQCSLCEKGDFLCQYNHETQCSLCAWKRGHFLCQCNHETQCSLCEEGGISCVYAIMEHNVHSLGEGEFLVSMHS